jgi:hypothetical protein
MSSTAEYVYDHVFKDLPRALLPVAHEVLEEAKRRAGRGDEPDPRHGHLQDSGGVEVLDRAVIVFFDAPHAAKLHEDLSLRHPSGGEPKYLENALKSLAHRMEEAVAGHVRARTATGTTGPGFSRSHHAGD